MAGLQMIDHAKGDDRSFYKQHLGKKVKIEMASNAPAYEEVDPQAEVEYRLGSRLHFVWVGVAIVATVLVLCLS